ncbi:MAG TPA: hypothetical protein VIQ51_00210, partial [Chryseosolibacter sp.]
MNKTKPIQAGIVAFMKFAFIQITIAITVSALAYSHDTNGQKVLEQRISLSVHDENVKTVLRIIEDKASVTFTYNAGLLSDKRKITLAFDSTRLSDAIDEIFNNSVEYEVLNHQVILRPRKRSFLGKIIKAEVPTEIRITGAVKDE